MTHINYYNMLILVKKIIFFYYLDICFVKILLKDNITIWSHDTIWLDVYLFFYTINIKLYKYHKISKSRARG